MNWCCVAQGMKIKTYNGLTSYLHMCMLSNMAIKIARTQVLLSSEEVKMLKFMEKKKGSSRGEIIRQAIREKYEREK